MTTNEENQRGSNQGFFIAIAGAIVLAFTGILIRIISDDYHLPALILAFWRDIFVVACAAPFFLLLKPKLFVLKRKDLAFLVAFGAVLALFNILWTLAVTLTGAALATVLVYSSTGFTALLGWIFLKEKLGWVKIAAVILCMFGCLLVSGALDSTAWRTNALGIITGAFSGLFYALYSLMGRRAANRELNPWTTLFFSFLFAAMILLVINLLPLTFLPGTAAHPEDMFFLGTQWRGWGLLVLLAAGPTLVGFGLYNISLGLLPSSTANLILTLEPVITVVAAYFLFGERLTLIEGIGSGLILLALLIIRVRNIFGEPVRDAE